MKVNLKHEYKEAYKLTKRELLNIKDMKLKRQYVDKRLREKKMSDLIGWDGDLYYKNVISSAFVHAINDHKKECHQKGYTIYGRKLK